MLRRRFFAQSLAPSLALSLSLVAGQLAWHPAAQAASEAESAQGVKAALERGAVAAVELLGKSGGFLDNGKVRIPLPEPLKSAKGPAKMLGMGKQFDELETSINRAAEQAVPQGKQLLVDAVRKMSVQDAVGLVTGGETAVTDYFRKTTGPALHDRFLPVVTKSVSQVGLAKQYEGVAGKLASTGLIKGDQADINQYVTGKTVDGLFAMIAEEERKIRQDPIGTGSAILKKVFGG